MLDKQALRKTFTFDFEMVGGARNVHHGWEGAHDLSGVIITHAYELSDLKASKRKC